MLNEFGSYAGNIDNTKNDLNRKNLAPERTNCCGNADIGPRPPNIPVPSATWNCNPYLGNFYNYYNNSYDISDLHQYDNQKCGNQFSRNYGQHTIQSASVLQCCDPRCQLFSEHSKYPFSANLASKYGNQRNKRAKYGIETKTDKISDGKYVGFPCMQNDLNKYNGQQQNYNALYQNPIKPSKHVLLPESSTFGEYYTDIGKPSCWNNKNLWNRGSSYYSPFEHEKMQKINAPQIHEQNNVTTSNQRGILFNRLLEHRNRSVYDAGYMPNYHCGRQPQIHKGNAYQNYSDRDMYAECNTRLPLQNNSYQSLPLYNVHYLENTVQYKDTKDKVEEKNRILDKNPNLDVREFLSTWDDVEDEKPQEAETPVIVLDCTTLEGDALAKVKEKLGENVTDCNAMENNPAGIEFNSEGNATVLKVVEDPVTVSSTCVQENISKEKIGERIEKSADSSHPDSYWYGHKKKDDLSYDIVEMTERLVNTVDKLFGEEKSDKEAFYDNSKETEKNEDQWNINFNYKRNKTEKPVPVIDQRYRSITNKDDILPSNCKPFPEYEKEPEKNVSCSFNLQKTNNDLKFSVNYSKQTECYSSKVQDYSLKYKNSCDLKKPPQRVEDYSYKNYYNSYYYNNPSCEYMQIENVKECTYDVENIDREISNDNASDITNLTLVKADLEKSLKEITHQFSYQKTIESGDKESPKCDKTYDQDQYISEPSVESVDEPKRDVLSASVIQKTGICSDKDDHDPFNENSLLSMPSLSPPQCSPCEPKTTPVGLTLNDVYEDQVIFDTSNKEEESENVRFTNRESVVYPLNLALAKESKEPKLKFTGLIEGRDDVTLVSCNDADPVFKVDDGYYSVEPQFDKDSKIECDEEERKMGEEKDVVYKTCIVSREQYENSNVYSMDSASDEIVEIPADVKLADKVLDPVLNLTKENEPRVENVAEISGNGCTVGSENVKDSNERNSSGDDELEKYEQHGKLKIKKIDELDSPGDPVGNEDSGNVTRFKHILNNIHADELETVSNAEDKSLMIEGLPKTVVNGHLEEKSEESLPILIADDNAEDDTAFKKRKFSMFVKETDLPMKKRKQDRLAGIDSFADKNSNPVDLVPAQTENTIVEQSENEENEMAVNEEPSKSQLNGKYPVEIVDQTLTSCSPLDEDVSRSKKNKKKKHKKDKHKDRIKVKKARKEKNVELALESEYINDTKSPSRTMLDDGFNDPCKFQSSGTENVVSNHDIVSHATSKPELLESDAKCDTAESVGDADQTNELDVVTGVETGNRRDEDIELESCEMRNECVRRIDDLHGEHEIARSRKKINWSRKRYATSDDENYMSLISRPQKKFKCKNVTLSDDESRRVRRFKKFRSLAHDSNRNSKDKIKSNKNECSDDKRESAEEIFEDCVPEQADTRAPEENCQIEEPSSEIDSEGKNESLECFELPTKFSLFELEQQLSPLSSSSIQDHADDLESKTHELLQAHDNDASENFDLPPVKEFHSDEIQAKIQSDSEISIKCQPDDTETEQKSFWSTENSPSHSVDYYQNKSASASPTWTPIPSDMEYDPEMPKVRNWSKENSPYSVEPSDPPKSIWSNENSPVHSDEEFDEPAIQQISTKWSPARDSLTSPSKKSTTSQDNFADSETDDESVKSNWSKVDSDSDDDGFEKLEVNRIESSPKNSYDELSNCDENETKMIDDFFNIPSVAPTPNCDLSKEDAEEPKTLLNTFDKPDNLKIKLLDISSKAPSPNCVLNEDQFTPVKSPFYMVDGNTEKIKDSQDSYFSDASSISSVAPSPNCDIIDGVLLDDTDTGKSDFFDRQDSKYKEVSSLRTLAAKVLSKMSFNTVSTFNRNNLLEVWVTPERTEIIIHAEETESNQTDLVITNDNHLMITDASYEDEEVNIAPNFDKIKEISFDYMGLESIVTNEKSEEDLQCQCLIISSEESVVCLRCSLNSSIIVNQDLNDIANDYDKPKDIYESSRIEEEFKSSSPSLDEEFKSSYFSNDCIEDSFIDQKLTISPEYIVEDNQCVDTIIESVSQYEEKPEPKENPQLKVEIPWHKIFNLGQQTANSPEDQKTLELGPAKIEVRLSPNDASLWKLVNSKNDRVSPVLKVKRLVLQRASDLQEKHVLESIEEQSQPTNTIVENVTESPKEIVNRLPKMVIKKTSCKEYKSYLQLNTLQPVVKLIKSKSLDELARRMCQKGEFSINLKKFKRFSNTGCLNDDLFGSSPSHEDVTDVLDDHISSSPGVKGRSAELQPKPECHHCLLCHRSFASQESYQLHIKGRFHRHLELTQRKTIHAIYRHFTGHICPRLRPLSAKERKKMKWKPRSANVNHFYHQKTPLQIALHKSVFGNRTEQEYS